MRKLGKTVELYVNMLKRYNYLQEWQRIRLLLSCTPLIRAKRGHCWKQRFPLNPACQSPGAVLWAPHEATKGSPTRLSSDPGRPGPAPGHVRAACPLA